MVSRKQMIVVLSTLILLTLGTIAYLEPRFYGRTLQNLNAILSVSNDGKKLLGEKLRNLAVDLLKLQRDFATSSRHFYTIGHQIDSVNNMLLYLQQETVVENITNSNTALPTQAPKKQEVCPEKFVGKDLGYGAPYYRLGFARIKCKEFVPIEQLITLLMYAPKEFPKPSMNYLEMMQGVEKYYPQSRVILATSQPLQEAIASSISKLKIEFKNVVFKDTNQGSMWASLLAQVETPYVLIAPHITHFDDDIDLYRLVRVLSYNDNTAVAGGSYRNVTAQWDLGCRQVSFNYWTVQYSSGYYQSFSECVVCDYLPGPFAAKTKVLKELNFDQSLSKGAFHDLFWRLKRLKSYGNVAVVCADVMFNIDTPSTADSEYAAFANKHEIKKLVEPDGRVRWYGCKRGISYTKGRKCSWPNGIGAPPCDLSNLGEVIRFTMTSCEQAKLICEYAAGTVLGAVKFGSVIPWEKDADIHFHTKNYSAFNRLRGKFESAGFGFSPHPGGLGGFSIHTTRWRLSLYGRKTLEVGDMLAQHKLPTRVPMAGAWVTTPRNPGLFSRNHYVHDYFRHAEHHGGNSFYKSGEFKKCPKPGHSACLDQYPADGNMQFLDYVP